MPRDYSGQFHYTCVYYSFSEAMIKLSHMRQFLAVCQHSSLAEAARALHRTPSAVSMTLKQIEEELGQPLFEGERKQQLTPMGEYTRDCAARALTEHQKAVEAIEQFAKGASGRVKVSAVPSVATHLLPLAMVELYKGMPDVEVDLRDIDSSAVARTVSEGASDFGIASLSARSTELKTELLMTEPFMCICQKEHPLARKRKALSWEDIAKYPLIANGLIDQIESRKAQALGTSALLRMRNVSSLMAFVRNGFGITLLPRMAALLAPDLCAKPLQDKTAMRELYLLQQTDRSLSPASAALINCIRKQIS